MGPHSLPEAAGAAEAGAAVEAVVAVEAVGAVEAAGAAGGACGSLQVQRGEHKSPRFRALGVAINIMHIFKCRWGPHGLRSPPAAAHSSCGRTGLLILWVLIADQHG